MYLSIASIKRVFQSAINGKSTNVYENATKCLGFTSYSFITIEKNMNRKVKLSENIYSYFT